MIVIKRDGRKVEFRGDLIVRAISKAGFVHDDVKKKIAAEIENCGKKEITVEEIQNIVERKLMATKYKDVAKEYVRYRYTREIIRESEKLNDSILDIISTKNEYVLEENSNKNPTVLSTQRDYMAGEVSKELSKRLLLPEEIIRAHEEGILHFHK